MYVTLAQIHIACVIASGAGFLLRGALMLADSPLRATHLARVAPHVVDSIASAATAAPDRAGFSVDAAAA